jgi:hypothetical protein
MTEYQAATTRLRELSAEMGSDAAQGDAQHYERLANEQIALMDQAVDLLAASLYDEANAKSRFPLSQDAARDLARDTLRRSGLVW